MSRRLFFGLKPDEQTRNAIDRVSRTQPDFNGRPHHPEDLHMTLVFLGQVVGKLDGICEAAAGIRVPQFTLTLDRFTFWPKPGILLLRPSAPPGALFDLVMDIRAGLNGCGFVEDHRSYKPHITLARKAKPIAAKAPNKAVDWYVRRFGLFVSSPVREPPYYRMIEQWPLLSETLDFSGADSCIEPVDV